MSDVAIRVENLSKRYSKHTASSGLGRHVRRWLGGSRTAGNMAVSGNVAVSGNAAAAGNIATSGSASSRNSSLAATEPASNDFWALKDVSFEVKHGEVIGVIGRNGAGKSTLLKILSKITAPTSGRAHIYGRVGSLLEVGTGFHPELTGRENIFLNGAVLRMSRREIRDKFDEIVDFAEVAEFIDTPVKHYSSGMYMRLAFAVAAHLDPEILIVDEVLAVGDAAFQKKCLGKMGDVSRTGRTVLFVSHNMSAIRGLCKTAALVQRGQVSDWGVADDVIVKYMENTWVPESTPNASDSAKSDVILNRILMKNDDGAQTNRFSPGDAITFELHFTAIGQFKRPHFWIGIVGPHGSLAGANMLLDGCCPDSIDGYQSISCRFDSLPLLPQTYTVRVGARGSDGTSILLRSQEACAFHVLGSLSKAGLHGPAADALAWNSASMVVPYSWTLPDGSHRRVQGPLRQEL